MKEHIFVTSDDPIQDHDSVHKVQELIHGYPQNDLGYQVEKLHEFTDGCAAQYKSRHYVGDLSCSLMDFGYHTQCSYFETSHARGEQGRTRHSWVSREAEGEPRCFTTKGQNHKCREYVQVSC